MEEGKYKISDEVIKYIHSQLIQHPTGDGVKRAKFILNNKYLTEIDLKRIKHDLENPTDKIQFELAGGDLMLGEANKILDSIRTGNNNSTDIRRDSTINMTLGLHAQQNPDVKK